jgi:hypothetical protein
MAWHVFVWRWLAVAGVLVCSIGSRMSALGSEPRWFPTQAEPRGVVRTVDDRRFPEPRPATRMLVQSVAGLAALAVNEGRGDELVWVDTPSTDVEDWYVRMLRRRPTLEVRGVLDPWALVDRYQKRGVIRGYILYRTDTSRGNVAEHRAGIDNSVNVATSLAGLLGGVIVDESLEPQARQHGLDRLLDVRDKTQAWCFASYRDRFNRRMLVTQDPRSPQIRDLAIAYKALTVYGSDPTVEAALKWLEPPAPIMGWNGGDELETTRPSTIHGHFQTATNLCMNLPVLMAGSELASPAAVKGLDPRTIDRNDRRSAVSFVVSDGDNVQWLEGAFFSNPDYFASPDRGRIPLGWSCCFAQLAQLAPQAIERAAATQSPRDTFLEWGGGYYYPDLFARDRPDRWALLEQHARHTFALMKRTGPRIVGFNVVKFDSPDALRAYQAIAGQTVGLLAIFVFQYDRYEAGAGKTFWVKDRQGVEIPVISARYSIWEHLNSRPRSGTPAKVAREIRDTVTGTPPSDLPRFDWVIDHAWSYFRRAPGADEAAEDMPQEEGRARGQRGVTPITWCAERLPENIRVISPEELAWRVRMKHDPEQTTRLVKEHVP